MVTVRTARSDEIPALITTGDASRDQATSAYLADLLEKKCTRPEWCFVAEGAKGQLTGRVVLWTIPENPTPMDFVLLDAPWQEADLATAQALLEHAGVVAADAGATFQGHVLDLPAQPPQFQTDREVRERLLQRNGFALVRDGKRYEWRSGTDLPAEDQRLTWLSLAELGSEPFVDALAELLADTRDSLLNADIAELGLRGAAVNLWEESATFAHQPEWYEIGYDPDGSAAAVSLPAHNPAYAVIGFAGVLPGHRGKGYGTAVVLRGAHILSAAGADAIRGDCDSDNTAMATSFERGGFTNFADRRQYRRSLPAGCALEPAGSMIFS